MKPNMARTYDVDDGGADTDGDDNGNSDCDDNRVVRMTSGVKVEEVQPCCCGRGTIY